MKRLVIIDGKSVFYRGYYAMGALATSDGAPTGGVYGFAAIAMELVKTLAPDKVVVAWDKAKTSIGKRKAIYKDYKAGRVKPPEDFYAQIPLLRELVESLGWDFVECDDYEADDIIGTLARQADEDLDENEKCKWDTYIISSDLDMLQIVDENTRMYRLLKGFSKLEEFSIPEVEAKYGIRKAQFLDLKALKGDASDNIPGVPGIGEKGAVKLLNEYETLDGIYEHIDEIKGSVHDKLVAGKDSAYMSRKLAEIMFDAPVSLRDVPDLVVDEERIVGALERLEFRSLIRKFMTAQTVVSKPGEDEPYNPRHTQGRSAELMASDYMVTSSERHNSRHTQGRSPEPMASDRMVASFDGILEWDVKATMHADEKTAKAVLGGAAFWDLSQGKFLLNPLARKESGQVDMLAESAEGKVEEYARQQAEYEKLPKLKRVLLQLDFPLIPVLYKMEKRGMKIDLEYFENLRREYEARVAEIEQEIYKMAGREFNVNSSMQVAEVLFIDLRMPTKGIKKSARGHYSTGAKELDKLKGVHPIVEMIIQHREVAKLLSTYVVPLPALADKNARVHTSFTQDVTATGRLSSVNPNLQNIPTRTEEGKKIRTGFIADEGKVLVSADYSQFELRLAAALSGDEDLIRDFNGGIDIHSKTAAEAFGVPMEEVTKRQRRAAKVINFGVLYGMSAKGLADAAGMSITEAKQFIDRYFELRAPIKRKLEEILTQAREKGYVETYYGRRRPTPDVQSPNYVVRTAAERAAQNMPIQGTEADLMKKAMMKVEAALPEGAELIMQVHDSLIVECGKGMEAQVAAVLREQMEGVAPELPVKLAVDVSSGQNWGDL